MRAWKSKPPHDIRAICRTYLLVMLTVFLFYQASPSDEIEAGNTMTRGRSQDAACRVFRPDTRLLRSSSMGSRNQSPACPGAATSSVNGEVRVDGLAMTARA
ncbi:hypothetical protein OH77DRAFT_1057273 [Trametes cingulata]|nr:hypothetical protein OH77DRAFT_1057273 [Trametes cingulata]